MVLSFFLSSAPSKRERVRRGRLPRLFNKQSIHDPSWPRPPTLTRTPGLRKLLQPFKFCDRLGQPSSTSGNVPGVLLFGFYSTKQTNKQTKLHLSFVYTLWTVMLAITVHATESGKLEYSIHDPTRGRRGKCDQDLNCSFSTVSLIPLRSPHF